MTEHLTTRSSLYADILELQDNILFEYDYVTDILCFYIISNRREVLARKITDLTTFKNSFRSNSEEEHAKIVEFIDCILEGRIINTLINTSVFAPADSGAHAFVIKGKKGDGNYIGSISPTDGNDMRLYRESLGITFEKDAGVDVYNKRSILDYCKHCIESAPGKRFYVAILDLDNFKSINDTFGHFFGDEVLTTVSEVIKNNVEEYGKVGRVGGDEFFVVFDQVDDREAIRKILKKTREDIEASYKGRTGDISLTCSAGSCAYPECGENFTEIYKVADALLYLAKEKGRNRYILYREDLHKDLVDRVIHADSEKKITDIYESVSGQWNHSSIMERAISDYYVKGTLSLNELLGMIRNRFFADYVQIINLTKGVMIEQILGEETADKSSITTISLTDNFISEFKGLNYFRANSYTSFRNENSEGKKLMLSKKVPIALFYLIKSGDTPVGYVMFGKMCDNRKWAEQDILVLTSVAQLISLKI